LPSKPLREFCVSLTDAQASLQLIGDRRHERRLAVAEVAAPKPRHAVQYFATVRIADIDVFGLGDNLAAGLRVFVKVGKLDGDGDICPIRASLSIVVSCRFSLRVFHRPNVVIVLPKIPYP
jgi:hypothetical protein